MNRVSWAGLVCLLALTAGPALSQTTAPTSAPATTMADQSLLTELKQMESRLEQVKDLSTDFRQEKFTPLLRKPLVSTGRIRIVGNLMRWDTDKPQPSSMLISEKEIRLYYPKQKLLEIYSIDQQLARMAASPIPRIGLMQEHFDFQRGSAGDDSKLLRVVLRPKQESLRQHVDQVKLAIDRDTSYLREMEMVDADGDRTVIHFLDVKLNTSLSAADLELKIPQGTRISNPISGEGAQD